MMRVLVSVLWIVVTAAFGFDAVAQPCELRLKLQEQSARTVMGEMPCHETMSMPGEPDAPAMPEHHKDVCCCVALLTHVMTVDGIVLDQPLQLLAAWADPLPDSAKSISFQYEPPPPRA